MFDCNFSPSVRAVHKCSMTSALAWYSWDNRLLLSSVLSQPLLMCSHALVLTMIDQVIERTLYCMERIALMHTMASISSVFFSTQGGYQQLLTRSSKGDL